MSLRNSLIAMDEVYNDYAAERRRQLRKHPSDTLNTAPLGDALHVAGEEFGEAVRAYVSLQLHGQGSLREILKELIEAGTCITVLAARIRAQLAEQEKQQELAFAPALPAPALPEADSDVVRDSYYRPCTDCLRPTNETHASHCPRNPVNNPA